MKKVTQIILAIIIIALGYFLFQSIMAPVRFDKQTKTREAVVIERIVDIRHAERAYRRVNNEFTASFDELIEFVLNGELEFERKLYSEDDSVAMAELKRINKKNVEKFNVRVIDTIFGAKKLSPEQVKQLRYVPFSEDENGNNLEFLLNAGKLEVGNVTVPVFECKAPYKMFLSDLDEQLLVNLIDERKIVNKYAGIKVGSIEHATNDAGNWE